MPGTALQRNTLIALLGVGVFLSSVVSHAASATEKRLPPKPAPAKKPATKSSTVKKPAMKSGKMPAPRKSSYNRRPRSQLFRYRLARLKLQPERISEIQRALAQAGYLNREPNGKWDDPTSDAMRRYQQARGFPGTGLPEAKSLMKLGLGPHPLPEELDSTTQAAAAPLGGAGTADAPAETSPGTNPQQ